MTEREINALCDRVRQTAYDIHLYLGHGHLEKVYENALVHRLLKLGTVVNFSENNQTPVNYYSTDMAMGVGGGPVAKSVPTPAIESGSQEVDVTVSLSYEILN